MLSRKAMMGASGAGGLPTFTVTTTAPAQTLTLDLLNVAPDKTVTVDWGDGTSNEYTGDGTRTHQYAEAGVWTMTIDDPLDVVRLDLRDNQLAFKAGTIGKFHNVSNLYLWNLSNGVVKAGELTALPIVHLYLISCAQVAMGASDVAAFAETLRTLFLVSVPQVQFQRGLDACRRLNTVRYENALTQAQMDDLLNQFYTAFPNRVLTGGTIDLDGNDNEAPTGTLQAACPPTTGREIAYELVNDSCGVAEKHWTSVAIPDNPDVELPAYLKLADGEFLDDLEDAANWTAIAGTVTAETTLVKRGTQAIRITPTTGEGLVVAKLALSPRRFFNTSDQRMSVWMYLDGSPDDFSRVTFYLSSVADVSIRFVAVAVAADVEQGWNLIDLDVSQWLDQGDSWDNDMVLLQVRHDAGDGNTTPIVLDALEIGGTYQPAAIFCFDDGGGSTHDLAMPVFSSRNVAGTAYITSSLIDQGNYMTTANLQALDAAGWDVGNHTVDHPNLTTLSQADAQQQVLDCRLFLESIDVGDAARHVAYPFGAQNATVYAAMAAEGMLTGRGGGCVGFDARLVPQYRYCSRGIVNTTTLEQAKAWVDEAIEHQKSISIVFHGIEEDGELGTQSWYASDLQALIDYLIEQHVYILTISQVYALRSGPVTVKRPW